MKTFKLLGMFMVAMVAAASIQACGVKGDPVPPTTPPELGRGKATYRRATEEMAFPTLPPINEPNPQDENKDSENEP